jgi:transposase
MRGTDTQQSSMFSYLSPEERVPANHPLRPIRLMVDDALKSLSPAFSRLYSAFGRPSIPPEKLLRALLLQVLYTVRSERMLMEQLEYNLLFRWFVGLNMDEAVWVPTVFTKNRDRLLAGDIAEKFFTHVLAQARTAGAQRLRLGAWRRRQATPTGWRVPTSRRSTLAPTSSAAILAPRAAFGRGTHLRNCQGRKGITLRRNSPLSRWRIARLLVRWTSLGASAPTPRPSRTR